MDNSSNLAAINVALFCRLNLNKRCCIPIRLSEMGVLIYASIAQEPISPAAISTKFGITKPSATAILKMLKEREYIEHCPSQIDGRSYTIAVTQKGKELVETACNEYTKTIELMKTEMGNEDFEELMRLIGKANKILKEDLDELQL